MTLILTLETATPVCSVALGDHGRVVSYKDDRGYNDHSAQLTGFIDQVFSEAGCSIKDLQAVAVSMGPGSYTGLRIGVSTAKGLCYALGIPLVAIPTLHSMALGMKEIFEREKYIELTSLVYCPMIDARRMEVYTSLFSHELSVLQEVSAEIITADSFSSFLLKGPVVFFGNGADKTRALLGESPNAVFREFSPSARYALPLAQEIYDAGKFEDVAYFEPYYLKDFVAAKPRVKGL